MNLTCNSYGPRVPLRRLTRQVGGIISEMNYALRRLFKLMTACDRSPFQADVPEDYAEFLLRTGGVLRHEPSAIQRLTGEGIR